MARLLAIETSPRSDSSVSRALTANFIEDWKSSHLGGVVTTRDLTISGIPFIDLPWIYGAFTPLEQQSSEMKHALRISDELIEELMSADHIVLGTPMYNFSIPALLKAYFDQVTRVGITFTPEYQGLITGRKATVSRQPLSAAAKGGSRHNADRL
jgi:FMN-dependent NADH-azoreductase